MKIRKNNKNKKTYKIFMRNQERKWEEKQIEKNKKNSLLSKNSFFKCYKIRKQTFFDYSKQNYF